MRYIHTTSDFVIQKIIWFKAKCKGVLIIRDNTLFEKALLRANARTFTSHNRILFREKK